MKKFCYLILALLFTGTLYAQDNMTGEEIAQKARHSNRSPKGVVVKANIIMKNMISGKTETRNAVVITVDNNGLAKGLFRFTNSSYSGTTMLTLERKGQDNLQYLYLPSVGSPRQIEGSDKEKNFVDTDFSNEDLGGSKVEDYTYKRLADQKIGGKDCYVLERYPKSKSSKFSKHVVILEKDSLIPISVQFYGKSGRIIKSMKSSDIRNIGSNIHVPFYVEVTDLENKSQTVLKVNQAVEKTVNQGYFNRNRMNMKWAEE
ncbi:MAG TPA: outer membrane lipoprotein-sorting protein [Spirochaetota bacterium]|nr:outer membrane lipoprotein-sorting protein [Spirochaetota bacterium]